MVENIAATVDRIWFVDIRFMLIDGHLFRFGRDRLLFDVFWHKRQLQVSK